MWNPDCILLDCRAEGRPIGLATGTWHTIDRLCADLNQLNRKRRHGRPMFQFSTLLEPTDCRKDLLAVQAVQLVEAAANAHHFSEAMATIYTPAPEPVQLALF